MVIFVVLIAVLATGVFLWFSERRDDGGGTQVPVMLVPGYAQTPSVMSALRRALEGAGRRVVSVSLPSRGAGNIDSSARFLGQEVERSGAEEADLVGFSAGAIVVRAYVQRFDDAGRARKVVLLGAPNHGAKLAEEAARANPALCFGACVQLRPGSDYLRSLNSEDVTPGEVAATSMWTSGDTFVEPPRSALLQGMDNVRVQDVCAGLDMPHGALVVHPLVVGLVLEALNRSSGGPPGAGACRSLRKLGAEALGR